MFPSISRARRRALVVIFSISLSSLASAANVDGALLRTVRNVVTIPRRVQATSITNDVDTAAVHGQLRRSIRQFQDSWRKVWKKSEMSRHLPVDSMQIRPLVFGDRERGYFSPGVRRYLSILCFAGTPSETIFNQLSAARQAFIPKGSNMMVTARDLVGTSTMLKLSWATSHMIVPRPNYGPVCPNWVPYEAELPLDEGEAIDLAIVEKDRAGVRLSRDSLITKLKAALVQYPTDEWIAGQFVRFTLDQRDPAATINAAKQCTQNSNRCASLLGLAFEQASLFDSAEFAYRHADSLLPRRGADSLGLCIDHETLWITPDGLKSRLRKMTCAQQQVVMNRMWWLADPLWGIPGNERYVAHGSRRLHATLRAVNDWDERYGWRDRYGGEGMRQLVVRYGWPSYSYWGGSAIDNTISYYLEATTARYPAAPYTAKEYSADRTALIPTNDDDVINPFDLEDKNFDLTRPEGKHTDEWWRPEHMMYPTYLDRLPIGQTAMWRRDTTITYQLAVDDPLRNLDTTTNALSRAVLMGGSAPENTRQLAQTVLGEGHTLRLLAQLKSSPVVLSAEVLPRTAQEQALRRRFGLRPPPALRDMKTNEVALSDPVFMRMPNRTMPVPTDEPSVLRYMAGALSFPRTEPMAIYWESYGFVLGDTLRFELKFRRDDSRNPARFLAGILGIVSDLRDSVSIKWTEPDPQRAVVALKGSKPIVGRSIAVDLSALDPGAYVMSIEMRKSATVFARSERRFTVTKP